MIDATRTKAASNTISAAILARVIKGDELGEAFDAVLGEGTLAKLVDDLYHELRAAKD